MKSSKLSSFLFFSSLLLLTLSCARTDESAITGTVTSIAEGDGGEGTIVWIDRGSNSGIKLNQEGWALEDGDAIATIRVDEVKDDTCRAVVLEHTPFKAVTDGLSVSFDRNGTVLSPETPAEKPCPDIPGLYVPTVGGNIGRTGSYDEKGVPSPIGVLWKFWAHNYISTYSPPVADNLIFFSDYSNFWYAITAADGKKGSASNLFSIRAYESPTVLNDTIFISGESSFHAYDEESGSEKWRYDMQAMAPAVSKDRVFLTSHKGTSIALDAATGKEIWRIETADPESGEQMFTTPALDGDTVYFGGADFYLYAVNARNGAVNWKYNVGWYLTSRYVVVGNDAIYVANRDYLIALNKQTHAEKWRFKINGYIGIAPAVACGMVYVFSNGNLYAVEAETGLEKWRFELREIGIKKKDIAYDPPIVVGGVVYFGGIDESVYAVDAETGKLLWSYKTEYKTSTPVIVDGVLYVTSGPYLYAIK